MYEENEFIIGKDGVLHKYCGNDSEVEIPDIVTAVGKAAFNECDFITAVYIPDGVTEIGAAAFRNCRNLTEVNLPEGLKIINEITFAGCPKLKTVSIPEGVTEIGDFAFYESGIKSLHLPASLKKIGKKAFNCREAGIDTLHIADIAAWCGVTFTDALSNPMIFAHKLYIKNRYTPNVIIPDGVRCLKDFAFSRYNGAFAALTVPESVTEFGAHSFTGPVYFRGRALGDIPREFEKKPHYALAGFAALYENDDPDPAIIKSYVDFLKSDMYGIGLDFILHYSAILTFAVRYSLLEAEDVDALFDAMPEKQNMQDRVLLIAYSNLVKGVPDDLDFDFDIIENDYVPPRLVAKEWRFRDTGSDETSLIKYVGRQHDVICPGRIRDKNVVSLGSAAFSNRGNINSVTLPASVKSIGAYAFEKCRKLRTVNIPEGVACIEEGTFSECNGLDGILIPEGVTKIGAAAFRECLSLAELELPGTLTELQTWAFWNCSSLISMIIPDSVTALEGWIFYECSHLETVRLPAGMQSIGAGFFCDCLRLRDVNIPRGVKKIGERAFKNCVCLMSLKLPEGLESIDARAFEHCTELSELVIPDSVTFIGKDAFKDCDKLSAETKRKIEKLTGVRGNT